MTTPIMVAQMGPAARIDSHLFRPKAAMVTDNYSVELAAVLAGVGAKLLEGSRAPDPGEAVTGSMIWVPGVDVPAGQGIVVICPGVRTAGAIQPLLDLKRPQVLLLSDSAADFNASELENIGHHVVARVEANAGDVVAKIARATQPVDESASRRLGSLQRSLSLALAEPNPIPALLARLKRTCNATVALIDRHGEVLHATGPVPRVLLFEEIASTKADTQVLNIDGWHGLAARVADASVPNENSAWLIVTSRRDNFPDAFATSAVHVATSLVEASERMTVVVRQQERAVRASVLEQALALRWERHDAELAARVAGLGIDFEGEARVVVATYAGTPRGGQGQQAVEQLRDSLDHMLGVAGCPSLLTMRENGVTMLVQCSVRQLQQSLTTRQDDLPLLHVGVGRPLNAVEGVVDSFHDAQLAVRTIRRVGNRQRLMAYEDFDFATRLFADVGLDKMVAWAEQFLSPLASRDNLLAGLRAYFEHDQNINLAAETLNIHHNSLRYRLSKVEELLVINLKQPAAVSSVFLALTALDLTRQSAALRRRSSKTGTRRPADVDAPGAVTRFEIGAGTDFGVVLGPDH